MTPPSKNTSFDGSKNITKDDIIIYDYMNLFSVKDSSTSKEGPVPDFSAFQIFQPAATKIWSSNFAAPQITMFFSPEKSIPVFSVILCSVL